MSFGERLKALRKHLGITQATAAKLCNNMPLDTWKKFEGERNAPGFDALVSLSATGCNLHWLILGEGAMLLKDMAGSPPPLREEELKAAVETVEEALQATNRVMIPAKKAQMITAIYKLFIEDEEGKINKATVLQLVKTAA